MAVIRSLGRAGHVVIAADEDRRSSGFRSRHATASVVYEPPARSIVTAGRALADACVRYGVDLAVPVTDEAAVALASAGDALPASTVVAVANEAALSVAGDKRATIDLARCVGVPVPDTVVVEGTEDAMAAAADLGWPVVVKPARSRVASAGSVQSRTVDYAGSPAELATRMAAVAGEPVLLQRFHGGTGVGVNLLAHEGRVLAAFQHERVREVPITGGPSAMRRSVPLDDRLLAHARALLEAVAWTGLAMVEFKVHGEDARLMEINGRIWGSLPVAVRAGVDFPLLLARLHLEGPPSPGEPPVIEYEVGVRSRNLWLETRWAWSVLRPAGPPAGLRRPRRREAAAVVADLFRPGTADDHFELSDPMPGFSEVAAVARRLVRRAGR